MCVLAIAAICSAAFVLMPKKQPTQSSMALTLPKTIELAHGYLIVRSRSEGRILYGFALDMVLKPKQINIRDGVVLPADFQTAPPSDLIGEACFIKGTLNTYPNPDELFFANGMYISITHIEGQKWLQR